jgi:hypothetical protein
MTTHQTVTRPPTHSMSIDQPRTGSTAAGISLAVLRVSMGFVFLWAFLDKTFGLHYATPSAKAWIHGGSPTQGFLKSVDVGPCSRGSIRSPGPGGRTGCSCSACSASASP